MVDDFHTLFKKDADIARRISPARSNNPFGNSNFATTASGKLAMLRIKLLFEVAMRNMPDVFWLPANWTNAFKSAALKYHLEHALTRSNTISEFKTNFTHNVKRSQHTPQTQRLIKQITQGLDGLEKDAQELAKMSDDELTLRGIFGENYAEFKGKGQEAINHLLETKSGQVQGAFHRDDLGDIDLVWGNDEIGLKKIINKHLNDFADFKGDTAQDKLANALNEIIAKGNLEKTHNGFNVNFNGYIVGLNRGWNENGIKIGDNKWIVTAFDNNKEISEKATATNFTRGAAQPQNLDEIIPNSNSQSQAPQKSLLEQARENTERLRAAQEAEQIAQKEAELARLKEMQAKNAEILAQKEAAAGQAINEAQSLQIGMPIKTHKISDTKIIINDNTAPFKAEFIIAKKDDIKPNFERTGTQGRSERQDKVIESIQSDFKPHLIFEQMGGFEGLPIILKDGQVIAGNHRAQAIKGLTGENLARYKQAAKEKFGVDLKDDEVIVRLVKDGDEKELINLAFMSNVGRESNLGEKALANLAKYDSQIQALPSRINADSVFELESQVAKALDTQGNGLNVFDTNLALFSRLAKSTQNANILDSLNALKNLSQDEKEKVLRMFVSNAGEFHNLAKDTQLKSLNLNDYLADALIVAAKNVDSTTRAANYAKLLDDIITMQASAKEMLKIDPFLFENFKSKALGYALARFARLENPSAKLFEFLKASKADLENLYTGNIFESNKAISDIDIYDFLKHAINSGEDLIDKQGRNIKGEITSRLDDLRKVENALIDSGEIQFAKSKAKPQGREAKETNINSLFADDELQMQATKPAKELNLSDEKDFNELSEFFKLNSKDKEFNEIFAKATKAAQKLGVKVKFDESAARSHFVLNDNTITIAAANKEHFQAQDLLHELIHATTRKALKDFNENPAKAAQTYTKRQIEAINEIISLYQKSKGIAKRQGKDAYALQNVDEFVAELSSGEFRAFLKAQDIFERFIKALIRFFTGDSERLAKNVNSYKALKESYYKILDDYEPPLAPQKIADERALKSVDELNLFETTPTTQDIKQTLQNKKGQLLIKDEKGKNHFINEKLVKAWQDEFKLANAQDDFLPEFSPQIKDILAKNGVDEIHLKIGSLVKINARDRGEFIKHIKPTLQEPNALIRQNDGALIFVKDVNEKKFFASVAKNERGEWVITSNAPKTLSNLKNKINDGGELLHSDLPELSIIAQPELTAKALNGEANADEIIPNSSSQSQVKDLKSFELYINKQRELVNAEKSKYETLYEAYHKADDTLKEQIEKQGMDYREWYNAQKEGEFTPQKQKIVTMYENAMQQESKYKKALKNLQETAEHFRDIKILSEKVNSMSDKEYCKRLSSGDAFMTEDYFQQSFNKSRKFYETLTNSNPLKEFGTNYAEFYRDGQGAVKKLLAEKQGQVAGAFYRDDLAKATGTGEIDLVWGDSTKGLQHILERRAADFETQGLTKEQATQKALEFVENDLNEIIAKGNISFSKVMNRVFFDTDTQKAVIALDYDGKDRKWVLTAFNKNDTASPRPADMHQSEAHGVDFSSSSHAEADEIIPNSSSQSQVKELSAKEKAKLKEQYHKNAYFKKLKNENPNLNENEIWEKVNDTLSLIKGYIENIKTVTRIRGNYYPSREIKLDKEVKAYYDDAYTTLPQMRSIMEDYYNTTPLKEFGTNYAEFYGDGQGAVKKLLAEKQGQVAGAFYRQDLGDITLAWGKSYKDENGEWRGFGLAHILDKHGKEFEDLARELSEVIEKGVLVKESDDKIILKSPQHTIILGKKENNKFVVTGYRQNNAKKLETTQTGGAGSFADETHPRNSLSSNQQEIIPISSSQSQVKELSAKEKQTRFTMRQNAYKSLKEVEKTPLTNANDGRVAYLNKTGRQESLSDYAINESAKNGFDEVQHLATAQHLPALFENAKFKETTRDLKNNDKNVKIHRYTANFLLDNEPAQAQITLKETIAGQHSGNKIYTLKLESVSRLSPAEPQNPREALSAINDPKSSGFGEPSTKPSEIVSKIQEKFKFGEKKAKDLYEWHKDSSPLTKNDDGTPKVFYHGSPNEFEVFDIEKTRGELGHYFTDNKSYAEQYMRDDNGKLYAVFVKSKNIISLFDPKAAQKYKKFIFGDDLPELEKILKERYKSSKVSEYDLDNYKSAFYDLMRKRNDKNVLRVPSIIGERLKTAGVDGVVSYKGAIVVFDSKQIKSIDNTGSWTDSAGKITKEKPSDESARHSYFNAQSPNILHSNEIWGGGLAGGTLNGLETDEDGNIIGFNPAKFVAGFIAGAGGTKAVKSQFAKKYATITSEKIKKSVQNALENLVRTNEKVLLQNPQGFIKELDKKGIAELLNSKGNIKMSVGDGKAFKADEVALNLPQNVSKMERKRLELFSNFIKNSLDNANFEKSFNFGKVSDENAQRLKMITNFKGQKQEFDLKGYSFEIDANDIRHIKNNHPDDLDLLNNLYDIYHNFDKAQWDITKDKRTGKNIISISFFKEYKDGTAKAVEVRVNENKKLKLKTLFRIDKGV